MRTELCQEFFRFDAPGLGGNRVGEGTAIDVTSGAVDVFNSKLIATNARVLRSANCRVNYSRRRTEFAPPVASINAAGNTIGFIGTKALY